MMNLTKEDIVRITGLVNATHLNGRIAYVWDRTQASANGTSRIAVRVGGAPYLIRPENLSPLDELPPILNMEGVQRDLLEELYESALVVDDLTKRRIVNPRP